MRLLLIEDDHMIADSIQRRVRRQGDAIDWACNGREARLSLENDVYDLVLLDLGIPLGDGLSIMKEYRRKGGVAPVIVITARDAIEERIICLDAGADDFLVKPFDLGELSARMRAIARRRAGRAQPVIRHGALTLDPAAHQA